MLGYYLFLAWKSIRRTPGNSLIVFAGMTLGVAVATMFSAVYHAYSRDPIPGKSGVLYAVRMDSWNPQKPHPNGIPPKMTYQDVVAIMKSDIPRRQTGSYTSWLRIAPTSNPERSRADHAQICHADFFTMFNLPFRYGSPWTRESDEKAERVVVVDDLLNQRFFGGENSVGQLVTIEDHEFRIVGVLAPWQPPIRYYDPAYTPIRPAERFYISMSHARPMLLVPNSGGANWKMSAENWPASAFIGELAFVQMWVELEGAEQIDAYKAFLDLYALGQKQNGRFLRPLDNRVTPLLDFMKERNCPPKEVKTMAVVANLFLVGCAITLMGLLWARFLARTSEVGVRRALGASRRDIFAQHILECEVIALSGGVFGSVLATMALRLLNFWHRTTLHFDRNDDIFRMDGAMLVFALLAAISAGFWAGFYPAYRACRIAPASRLKLQ